MTHETGGLTILGILTAVLGACSLVGWLSGWPIVGAGTGFGALCGGAMLVRAVQRRRNVSDE